MKTNHDFQLQRDFGLRVKELRDSMSMTQEDLADGANLFRTYLSRIETGMANPSLTVIHALARALDLLPSALLQPPTQGTTFSRTRAGVPMSRGRVTR